MQTLGTAVPTGTRRGRSRRLLQGFLFVATGVLILLYLSLFFLSLSLP